MMCTTQLCLWLHSRSLLSHTMGEHNISVHLSLFIISLLTIHATQISHIYRSLIHLHSGYNYVCLLSFVHQKSITLSSRRPISTMAGVIKHTCTRFVLYLRFVHILITYYIYHSTYTNEYISLYPCTCVQCHISYNSSSL